MALTINMQGLSDKLMDVGSDMAIMQSAFKLHNEPEQSDICKSIVSNMAEASVNLNKLIKYVNTLKSGNHTHYIVK